MSPSSANRACWKAGLPRASSLYCCHKSVSRISAAARNLWLPASRKVVVFLVGLGAEKLRTEQHEKGPQAGFGESLTQRTQRTRRDGRAKAVRPSLRDLGILERGTPKLKHWAIVDCPFG